MGFINRVSIPAGAQNFLQNRVQRSAGQEILNLLS
jgi:hypothetical protein